VNDQTQDPTSSDVSTMSRWRARFWLGVGLPTAILAVGYIPFVLLRSELPDRLATHFDGAGRADDSMAVGSFLGVTGAMVGVGLALCVWLARSRRPVPVGVGSTVGFLGPFVAALAGGIVATTAVSQRGIDNWTDAPNAWWSLIVAVVAALLAGIAGARCGSHLGVPGSGRDAVDTPVMDLSDAEQAVWTTSLRSTPLHLLGLSCAIVGVVLFAAATPWLGVGVLVSAVPLSALATVRVRVDRTGLGVSYGWLPWPRTAVSVERIEAASIIDVRPMEWGGWGYRGSLKVMNQAAVVHRAGPGIRLDLTNGKVFVVTVDEPATGVALLNAQIQRRVIAG